MRTFAWVIIAALGWGCNGAKKPPEEPEPANGDDGGSAEDGAEDPAPSTGDDDDDGGGEETDGGGDPEPAKPKPVTAADDYEINHSDCEALAQARGNAWERDEIKKLEGKKLNEKQHAAMEETLKKGAASVQENYLQECVKTVGTAYLRSRLQCAVKAKSIQAFDNCMAGTTE